MTRCGFSYVDPTEEQRCRDGGVHELVNGDLGYYSCESGLVVWHQSLIQPSVELMPCRTRPQEAKKSHAHSAGCIDCGEPLLQAAFTA